MNKTVQYLSVDSEIKFLFWNELYVMLLSVWVIVSATCIYMYNSKNKIIFDEMWDDDYFFLLD